MHYTFLLRLGLVCLLFKDAKLDHSERDWERRFPYTSISSILPSFVVLYWVSVCSAHSSSVWAHFFCLKPFFVDTSPNALFYSSLIEFSHHSLYYVHHFLLVTSEICLLRQRPIWGQSDVNWTTAKWRFLIKEGDAACCRLLELIAWTNVSIYKQPVIS